MALDEVTQDELVQRCGKCEAQNRIALGALEVGVTHGGRADGQVVPLPPCPACNSSEYLIRSAEGEEGHLAPGSFSHLHRLLVDFLHAELVRRDQVVAALRDGSGRADPKLLRLVDAAVLAHWFPAGLKVGSSPGEQPATREEEA